MRGHENAECINWSFINLCIQHSHVFLHHKASPLFLKRVYNCMLWLSIIPKDWFCWFTIKELNFQVIIVKAWHHQSNAYSSIIMMPWATTPQESRFLKPPCLVNPRKILKDGWRTDSCSNYSFSYSQCFHTEEEAMACFRKRKKQFLRNRWQWKNVFVCTWVHKIPDFPE